MRTFEIMCMVNADFYCRIIYDDEPMATTFKVNRNKCSIKYVEHVVVHATLKVNIDDQNDYPDYYSEDYVDENPYIIYFTGPRRGAITLDLRSPHGTPSHLLPQRKYDFVNEEGYDHWPFMSVQHWGENPYGYWNVSVRFYASGGHIRISNLSMTLYGTKEIPEAVKNIPNRCDQSCANIRGCSYGDGSEYCDACQSLRMADSLLCVTNCPNHYCDIAGYCDECPPNHAGVIAAAVMIPTAFIATAVGSAIVAVVIYWKWRNREGYTKF